MSILESVKDDSYGTRYIRLGDDKYNVSHSYVTNECFVDNDTIVTARTKSLASNSCNYVRTDLTTGEDTLLYEGGLWPHFTVLNGTLYHTEGNTIRKTNVHSAETKTLWEAPHTLIGPISVTDDERFAAVSFKTEENNYTIGRVELETGEYREFHRQAFPEPFNDVSHCMLSPADSDDIFFCHEGNCCYITNRLWYTDARTGATENIFKQHLDKDGNNGECCGHEHWSYDGEGLYFIKYISTSILPRGVWYINIRTKEDRPIATNGAYWHVGVSRDELYLAADTQVPGAYSDVVLINLENGQETPIIRAKTNWTHPCHPHPVFSPDGQKLCFTYLGESGRTEVGIVQIKH